MQARHLAEKASDSCCVGFLLRREDAFREYKLHFYSGSVYLLIIPRTYCSAFQISVT